MRLFRQKKQQTSHKREIRNESKEKNMDDFLLKQIDEFRDKAQQLQDLINTKETKVRELQLLVDERESKATKLQMELDERQREADSLVGNVEEQVDKVQIELEGGVDGRLGQHGLVPGKAVVEMLDLLGIVSGKGQEDRDSDQAVQPLHGPKNGDKQG